MLIDECMKAACWIVCPMCDEPKCVGRFNCPEIKAWIEKNGGMTMRRNREDCPVRHENGNCLHIGSFCTAVPDPICAGVRSAYECGWTDCAMKIRKEQQLKSSPTIEAEPVRHGRWEKRGQEIYCSKCGEESGYTWAGASRYSDYCPNCGAKLDKE